MKRIAATPPGSLKGAINVRCRGPCVGDRLSGAPMLLPAAEHFVVQLLNHCSNQTLGLGRADLE